MALGFVVCACTPDLEQSADALVVTETGVVGYSGPQSPERAAAVAEMRQNAEAGVLLPYPDVFRTEQVVRLAARPEPRPLSQAEAIAAELAAIARRQSGAISQQELAALEARAAELRRLAAEVSE
jgi:hypothetical protein